MARRRKKGLSGYKIPMKHSPGSVVSMTKKCGSHFFDQDTMRFFNSRLTNEAYVNEDTGLIYYVTSEKSPHGSRAYSVREFDSRKCRHDTVGEFMEYKTLAKAKAIAKKKAGI